MDKCNEMVKPHLLIADDDEDVRETLRFILGKDYVVSVAVDGVDAIKILQDKDVDLVLLDLTMPRMNGLEVLRRLNSSGSEADVVMISATDRAREATEAIKLGAFDYLTKPFDEENILSIVDQVMKRRGIIRDIKDIRSNLLVPSKEEIVYRSRAMHEIVTIVRKVAPSDCDILVSGESGTGKELIAQALHSMSPRAARQLVAINCAAIPAELLESELFGHEKGSFTGAHARKVGKFEYARGGTIFLDEINSLRIDLQAKLLRVLQEREFVRIGGNDPIRLDARVVAATNVSLEEMVKEGSFREDLYYRLNVIPIRLPALRERQGDISLLAMHFLKVFNEKHRKRLRGVTPEAMAVLESYPWPGNIRELKNLVERAVLLRENDSFIDEVDLPAAKLLYKDESGALEEPIGDSAGLLEAREAFEKQYILRHLRLCGGNQSEAARRLGIHRNTLLNKLRAFDISARLG